jgi:ATP-binding cassette, subfamily B, bacterial PglK
MGILLLIVKPIGAILTVALISILGCLYFYACKNKLKKWGKDRQRREGLRLQYLQQGLGGVKKQNYWVVKMNLSINL